MKLAPFALAALFFAAPALAATPAAPVAADWRRPDPDNVLVVDSSKGRIIVELAPWAAPAHVERIRLLTRQGFYNGLSFFRVIDQFMAQTGDPRNDGTGGTEDLPDLKAEFMFRRGRDQAFTMVSRIAPDGEHAVTETGIVGSLPVRGPPDMQMMVSADGKAPGWGLFCAGVLGMARGSPPDSANSQFFFMRQTYPSLDTNYTAFGRVISGLDAVRAIKVGEPVTPPRDVMTRVRLLSDIPAGERPDVQILDTASPSFAEVLATARATKGPGLSPCDIDIPVKVG
ncbi:MAG: peptidylprolyl isomerase [Caulobacter sp.]|nr:peptidylprolyl isomerase [Caulobacter sp.]